MIQLRALLKCQKNVKKDQSDVKDKYYYLIFLLNYLGYYLVEIETRRHSEETKQTIDRSCRNQSVYSFHYSVRNPSRLLSQSEIQK